MIAFLQITIIYSKALPFYDYMHKQSVTLRATSMLSDKVKDI